MTKARATLTELEGAVLGVIRRAPGLTAYRVRRVFLASPSIEWSGSAGAVYPALTRLLARRLTTAETGDDRRGTKRYALTAAGRAMHDRWLCDVERALSPGLDPFRTRAALWPLLPAAKQRALAAELRAKCVAQRRTLTASLHALDADDAVTARLHMALLDLRLRWLDENLGTRARSPREERR